MRVVFVHHHLRRGGVTRVLRQAVQSAAHHHVELCILSGESLPAGESWPVPVGVVDGLGYAADAGSPDPAVLEETLRLAATELLGGPPDVWHWHNHSLGKNPAVTATVARLAEAGEALVLQVHDFAEDGRPGNYTALVDGLPETLPLYPHAPRVVTAPINGRDQRMLTEAGLPESALFPLPNAVQAPEQPLPPGDPEYVLYPTRAIGRKNIGELLLWAGWLKERTRFGVTLAPDNPAEQPLYHAWKQRSESEGLPIDWEVGAGEVPFETVVGTAGAIITTSIAEGFGLAFLEPWSLGRPVVGRNLPDITADFTAQGIALDGLYEDIRVPLGELPIPWRAVFLQGWAHAVEAYGRPERGSDMEGELERLAEQGWVDFGRLSPGLQQGVLPVLWSQPAPDLGHAHWSAEAVAERKAAVAEGFGSAAYGVRLVELWHQVAAAPVEPVQWVDPANVLDAFLDPATFSLLRNR